MNAPSTDRARDPRRPPLPFRLVEVVGLVGVIYGLASSEWWIAVVGAITIVATYSVYRRRFGTAPPEGPDSAGMGE